MTGKSKYRPFDPVNYLISEETFAEYITALREDNAPEELIQDAYRDIERARVVHGIFKAELPATAAIARHAVGAV